MTTVTFEVATLQAVLKKAASIAPSRGKSFDVAAGIMLELRPSNGSVTIKSTNLDVFYLESVDTVALEGDDVDWRLPSATLSAWVGKLAFGSGKVVKFEPAEGRLLEARSGRARWKTAMIPTEYYPEWEPFDTTDLVQVEALGARIDQVAWAASREDPAMPQLEGIHVDGERLWTTNKYRCASTPCEFPLPEGEPITVAASIVAPIIKQMTDTKVGVIGNYLVLAPDEYSQIKVIMYGAPYPNLSRIQSMDYPDVVLVDRAPILDAISGMTVVSKDRQSQLVVTIGEGEMAFHMDEKDGTEVLDNSVELMAGQADHPPHEIIFGPENFVDLLSKGPNDKLAIYYDQSQPLKMVHVDGGSGYLCWTQPRTSVAPKTESTE